MIDLPQLTTLNIGYLTFNGAKEFSLNNLGSLQYIQIGDYSFQSALLFKIDGLKELKELQVGDNAFRDETRAIDSNLKSFHISNCALLRDIRFYKSSFKDFGGEFELKNLSSLQSLIIGSDVDQNVISYNFLNSSFVVEGRKMSPLVNN